MPSYNQDVDTSQKVGALAAGKELIQLKRRRLHSKTRQCRASIYLYRCSACLEHKSKDYYSRKMLRTHHEKRRCIDCTGGKWHVQDRYRRYRCNECLEHKSKAYFSRKMLKKHDGDGNRRCIDCTKQYCWTRV